MLSTYKTYLSHKELENYKNDIEILEVVTPYAMGKVVIFSCKNEKLINKIFP